MPVFRTTITFTIPIHINAESAEDLKESLDDWWMYGCRGVEDLILDGDIDFDFDVNPIPVEKSTRYAIEDGYLGKQE